MQLKRQEIREKVMEALYSCLIKEKANDNYDPREVLADVFDSEAYDNIDVFAREIFVRALVNKTEIISSVEEHLNRWTFDRLNTIAQAIFLLAVSECNYSELTEKPIVINCSVDLAKKYLDSKDYRYINAVLDKVLFNSATK